MSNNTGYKFLYYSAFLLIIFFNFIGHTQFSEEFSILLKMRIPAFIIAIVLLGIKILFDKLLVTNIYIYLIIFLVIVFIGFNIDNNFLFFNMLALFLLIISMYNISFKQVLKFWLILIGGLMLIVHISFLLGYLEDVTFLRGSQQRHSLGYIFTTLSSNYFMQFTLMYILYRMRSIRYIEMGILILINYYFFIKTDTKSAFYFAVLVVLLCVIVRYIAIPKKIIEWSNKYILVLSILIPIFLTYLYNPDNNFYLELNNILTGRLRLGQIALESYGFSFFGQKVEWVLFNQVTETNNFLYVDSSFLSIAINQGIILLILLAIGFYILGKRRYIKNNVYYMIVFMVLCLHSTFDPQFLEIVYNPMLLLLGMLFNNIIGEEFNDFNNSSNI